MNDPLEPGRGGTPTSSSGGIGQTGMLLAAFVLTLAVLTGAFFGIEQLSGGSAAPSPSPSAAPSVPPSSPSPRASVAPATPSAASASASPSPSASPAPTHSSSPTAPSTATRRPVATPAPAHSGAAASGSANTITVTVPGNQYINSVVPSNGSVTNNADGSVTMKLDRTFSDQIELDYILPPDALPAGATITSMDVLVCGTASGDFWESYGPEGSDPTENEVVPPAADGCWHYLDAPGPSTTVKAFVHLATTFNITRVQYTVTFAR